MHLFHGGRKIGDISGASQEGVWMCGSLTLAAGLPEIYERFFAFMTNEENDAMEPPFDPELLDPERWSVVDGVGDRRGVEVPAIHADDAIMWRWR